MPYAATHTCAECGQGFPAKSRQAKYCGNRCKKRANRRPSKLGVTEAAGPTVEPYTWAQFREELTYMLELLPQDIALLERRYPDDSDPVMDELIGGLDCHLSGLERMAKTLDTYPEGPSTR